MLKNKFHRGLEENIQVVESIREKNNKINAINFEFSS